MIKIIICFSGKNLPGHVSESFITETGFDDTRPETERWRSHGDYRPSFASVAVARGRVGRLADIETSRRRLRRTARPRYNSLYTRHKNARTLRVHLRRLPSVRPSVRHGRRRGPRRGASRPTRVPARRRRRLLGTMSSSPTIDGGPRGFARDLRFSINKSCGSPTRSRCRQRLGRAVHLPRPAGRPPAGLPVEPLVTYTHWSAAG